MNRKLLSITFLSILVLGVLHFVASTFYFYWTISWFDTMMHFLGGISIGLLCLWIYFSSGLLEKSIPSKRKSILVALISVIIIGILWEIFEYVFNIPQQAQNYSLDVAIDLIADSLGAVIVGEFASRKQLYSLKQDPVN